jgi:hypothetical protein
MKGTAVAKKTRSKDGLNKAQLIRDALKKLGMEAAAKDVQAYTESHGATVAPAQISNIRTKLKDGSTGKGKKKSGAAGGTVTADELVQVRVMAAKVGGVERAKELLDILNRLR